MKKLNEVVVGIVFFCAMGILGYYTIIRSDLFDGRKYYSCTVVFNDVEGLAVGNKVFVNGVESGSVSEIELLVNGKIIVTLKLYRVFDLYTNYQILITNQSALGGKIILINPGAANVKGKSFEIVSSLENLRGQSIGDPLTKISEVIDENREDIRAAVKNITDFSEKINKGDGTISKLVNEDTVHKDADNLLKDAKETMKQARDTLEDSREQAPVTSFIRALFTFF